MFGFEFCPPYAHPCIQIYEVPPGKYTKSGTVNIDKSILIKSKIYAKYNMTKAEECLFCLILYSSRVEIGSISKDHILT